MIFKIQRSSKTYKPHYLLDDPLLDDPVLALFAVVFPATREDDEAHNEGAGDEDDGHGDNPGDGVDVAHSRDDASLRL